MAEEVTVDEEILDKKIGMRIFWLCLAFFVWIVYFLLIGSVPPGLHGA